MLKEISRFFEITKSLFFLWYGFKFKYKKSLKRRADILKKTLENLGSVFIKFGQLLSMRPDIIPKKYCHELFYLLEDVKPFDKENVDKIFIKEFGKKPSEIFNKFEYEPIGSASFGQVHVGFLNDDKVAVKIQRPNIKKIVRRDIGFMKFFARIVDIFSFSPSKLIDNINEFEMWTEEELNYEKEAEYTDYFHEKTKNKYNVIKAPKFYEKFSSKKIITQEFIGGFTISKYLQARRKKDKKFLSYSKKNGFDEKKVANKLLINGIKQTYLDGYFHADPHPANIIFSDDGELYYIDFGIVGKLSKKNRMHHLRYTRSCIIGDYDVAFKELLAFCDVKYNKNMNKIEEQHREIVDKIFNFVKENKGDTPPLADFLKETIKLIHKFKLKRPKDRLRYFRAILVLQSVVYEIYPKMEFEEVSNKFITISLVNVLESLPKIIESHDWKKYLLKWINMVEDEIV